MVAVTTFVGRTPRAGSAALFGFRWGFGHALVVLVVGGVLAWTGVSVPRGAESWAELAVGVMLVALGVWAMQASRRLHVHRPEDHHGHAHLHAHTPDRHPHSHDHVQSGSRHGHLSTLVGAIHGLAGTAPIVALIPVTLLAGIWPAIGYLTAFGAGTILAMGLYAFLAAVAARRASSTVRVARGIALATGLTSLAVGIWWVVRAVDALTS